MKQPTTKTGRSVIGVDESLLLALLMEHNKLREYARPDEGTVFLIKPVSVARAYYKVEEVMKELRGE